MSGKTEYTEDELFSIIGRNYAYVCEMHDSIVEGRIPYGELVGLDGTITGLPEDVAEREDMACTFAPLAVILAEQNYQDVSEIDPTVEIKLESMAIGLEIMKVLMSARRLAANGYLIKCGVDEYGLPTYKKGKC